MSTAALALRDSRTMLRRVLLHARRYPSLSLSVLIMPVTMLLLFTFAFGGALGAGLTGGSGPGSAAGSGVDYIDYIAPGIMLMAATAGSLSVAVGVCVDMTGGIVNRFRTMSISRTAFLTGHVVGAVLQTMAGVVLVTVVAVLIGFRPDASPLEWLAALGLLTLVALALAWLSAGFGLVARTVESASNMPMPLQFLPFLGSAVVTPETMPAGLRWFAEHQPFTPVIETLRGLLTGDGIGTDGPVALAWCTGLVLVGHLWARRAFHRSAAGR
ncbi:ABC transporter permease [Streptomyces cacaoi]|uniref:ABC transporter permease n=1 Tax=Streptomyces cacaoi TaxID=1898 RepID=UPI00331E4351